MSKSTISMDELLAGSDIKNLESGDVIEGVVSSVKKHEVWIDLSAQGVGVVMRREIGHGQVLEPGQKVTVSVIDPELDEGYALLSMKRAAKDRGWDELRRLFEAQEIIEVSPYDANRGGLLVELEVSAASCLFPSLQLVITHGYLALTRMRFCRSLTPS
jgi:ribosomal protein S1